MVRSDNLYVSVPSFFRCPISLDVMKSPVSLCTGVTYDRSSIQAWLDGGNNTCPATMQVLPSKDFVPNLTLHRLIQLWSSSDFPSSSSPPSSISPQPPLLTQEMALHLLRQLSLDDPDPSSSLASLLRFASVSDRNRKLLAQNGCVKVVAGFLAGGERNKGRTIEGVEAGVRLLRAVSMEEERAADDVEKEILGSAFYSVLLLALQKGSLDCRIDSARLIESILGGGGEERGRARAVVGEIEGILFELLRLSGWESDPAAVEAGLAALAAMASGARPVRAQIARQGGVALLGRLLERPEVGVVERALGLLEALSRCPEGRSAISADPACVPAMVGKILKVSEAATERAVVVLWSLCCAFRDAAVRERVAGSNAAGKMLLLLQSNCAPPVRQMAGDLLKLFSHSGGAKGCLTSYDTKTTHIMPF